MTLPTTKDGGIDTEALGIEYGAVSISGKAYTLAEYTKLIRAHERERIALWHDEKERVCNRNILEFNLDKDGAMWKEACFHKESAAAIRKMED